MLGKQIAQQSEVIRAIVSGYSPCCGGHRTGQPDREHVAGEEQQLGDGDGPRGGTGDRDRDQRAGGGEDGGLKGTQTRGDQGHSMLRERITP